MNRYWRLLQTKGVLNCLVLLVRAMVILPWRHLSGKVRVRYYRALCGSMGDGVQFNEGVTLAVPSRLFIGNYSTFNKNCWIAAGDSDIYIGNHVMVGPMTMIIARHHRFNRLDIPMTQQGKTANPIVIGDDVWIGGGCIILAGVTIGIGSVIAAGSVVTHDIPPYSVAMGSPARVKYSRLTGKSIMKPIDRAAAADTVLGDDKLQVWCNEITAPTMTPAGITLLDQLRGLCKTQAEETMKAIH